MLVQHGQAGESLPQPVAKKLLVDSDEVVVGEVELVAVQLIRLGDAFNSRWTRANDLVRLQWRDAHKEFWRKEILPDLRLPGLWLDEDTIVVVERFRYVAG